MEGLIILYLVIISAALIDLTCIYDSGYPHDGRADKNPYPHDGRADKNPYPHDRRASCR